MVNREARIDTFTGISLMAIARKHQCCLSCAKAEADEPSKVEGEKIAIH
jgi:hypothetical protein